MTTTATNAVATPAATERFVHPHRSVRSATAAAFGAMLLRDLTVLRRNLKEFIPRTIMQPLLLVFVFTYVFPKIGQSVGGGQVGLGQLPADDDRDAIGQRRAGAEHGADERAAVHRRQVCSCCLRTLPVAFRGSSARKVIWRGTL